MFDALQGCNAATMRVFLFLLLNRDRETNKNLWKQKKIARELGISERSVKRAEAELEKKSLISIDRAKKPRAIRMICCDKETEQPQGNALLRGHPCHLSETAEDESTAGNALLRGHPCHLSETDKTLRGHPCHLEGDIHVTLAGPDPIRVPDDLVPESETHLAIDTSAHFVPTIEASETSSGDLSSFSRNPNRATETLLAWYEDLVVPKTNLPSLAAEDVDAGYTRPALFRHWTRYKGEPDIFRPAFEYWAAREGLWTQAGVCFSKLWKFHSKIGATWFDGCVQRAFEGEFFTDPFRAFGVPKLSSILDGELPKTWRYGVDVDKEATNGASEAYCELMREHAPHVYRHLLLRADSNWNRGRNAGADEDHILSRLCSSEWGQWRRHGGLLKPIVVEARSLRGM
jgi:hypothetical protein